MSQYNLYQAERIKDISDYIKVITYQKSPIQVIVEKYYLNIIKLLLK